MINVRALVHRRPQDGNTTSVDREKAVPLIMWGGRISRKTIVERGGNHYPKKIRDYPKGFRHYPKKIFFGGRSG